MLYTTQQQQQQQRAGPECIARAAHLLLHLAAARGLQLAALRGHGADHALLLQVLIAPVLAQLHNVVLALAAGVVQVDACGRRGGGGDHGWGGAPACHRARQQRCRRPSAPLPAGRLAAPGAWAARSPFLMGRRPAGPLASGRRLIWRPWLNASTTTLLERALPVCLTLPDDRGRRARGIGTGAGPPLQQPTQMTHGAWAAAAPSSPAACTAVTIGWGAIGKQAAAAADPPCRRRRRQSARVCPPRTHCALRLIP